jgi:alkyl sulfatase BDS1-like metallo-beta-lactamase superfamily hydrolase
MKLEELKKLNSAGPAATAGGDFKAASVFATLASRIESEPDLVKKINGVYQFNISAGAETRSWTVDLKNGAGAVKEGASEKPDCTISIGDDDFVNLLTGKANGQQLFMGGKMKIAGNMAFAMKLGQLSAAKASL